MRVRLPTFLVIGTAQAGTTALFRFLRQHPDVYVSSYKEPRFFAFAGERLQFAGPNAPALAAEIVTSAVAYRDLFRGATDEPAVGEFSPAYMHVPQAAPRIRAALPGVNLIAILRDPAERAYSNWLRKRRDGWEPLASFRAALDDEERRIREGWPYVWHYERRGYYHAQLAPYFELFDRRRLKIVLYEEWRDDGPRVMREILAFIGARTDVAPDTSRRVNVSWIPRHPALHAALTRPDGLASRLAHHLPDGLRARMRDAMLRRLMHRPPLASEDRARLVAGYREDIRRLEGLIDRDLSAWLAV